MMIRFDDDDEKLLLITMIVISSDDGDDDFYGPLRLDNYSFYYVSEDDFRAFTIPAIASIALASRRLVPQRFVNYALPVRCSH